MFPPYGFPCHSTHLAVSSLAKQIYMPKQTSNFMSLAHADLHAESICILHSVQYALGFPSKCVSWCYSFWAAAAGGAIKRWKSGTSLLLAQAPVASDWQQQWKLLLRLGAVIDDWNWKQYSQPGHFQAQGSSKWQSDQDFTEDQLASKDKYTGQLVCGPWGRGLKILKCCPFHWLPLCCLGSYDPLDPLLGLHLATSTHGCSLAISHCALNCKTVFFALFQWWSWGLNWEMENVHMLAYILGVLLSLYHGLIIWRTPESGGSWPGDQFLEFLPHRRSDSLPALRVRVKLGLENVWLNNFWFPAPLPGTWGHLLPGLSRNVSAPTISVCPRVVAPLGAKHSSRATSKWCDSCHTLHDHYAIGL